MVDVGGGMCRKALFYGYDIMIQVKDQYGDNLGPEYEGAQVVETVTGLGQAAIGALNSSGQINDPVGFMVSFESIVTCGSEEADDWSNAEPDPPPPWAILNWASSPIDHYQHIEVDDYEITPPYRRRIAIESAVPLALEPPVVSPAGAPVPCLY